MCDQGNQFDDGKVLVGKLNVEEVKELAKVPESVKQLEERVKIWCKKLAEILKESEQIRRESDSSGNTTRVTTLVMQNISFRASR